MIVHSDDSGNKKATMCFEVFRINHARPFSVGEKSLQVGETSAVVTLNESESLSR